MSAFSGLEFLAPFPGIAACHIWLVNSKLHDVPKNMDCLPETASNVA